MDYGYLRYTPQERIVMGGPGAIEILPVDPGYYYVPVYNPGIVFGRRAGVGAVISFGPRVFIGASFAPWGWRDPRLDWRAHTVVIDRRPWDRTWVNRDRYVHTYAVPPRERFEGPRVERHDRDMREHRDR